LLHELEHDLIHWQYFKNIKWVHHMMLLVGWILRPGTMNPWLRRKLHFLHHKTSGTEADMEERGIGNGLKYGIVRVWVMVDTVVGNMVRVIFITPKGLKLAAFKRILRINFPISLATAITTYSFLSFHIANAVASSLGTSIAWSETTLATMSVIGEIMVVLLAPFYLRSFSLNFISSNMHYYGNVNSVIAQTQVLNSPLFWPFQLFCFNFGSTHGIHHFVVNEPFYIRTLTTSAAHQVMREQGVHFNDLGTFRRTNRYEPEVVRGQMANA